MRRLLVVALPAFLTDLGFYLVLFTLSHVLEARGASDTRVALVFGIYNLAYACGAPLVGRWSDRRRLGSLLAGAILFALVYSGLAGWLEFTPSGPALRGGAALALACYGGMAVLAVSNALYWPAFQARLSDREPDAAALEASLRLFNLAWTSGKALGFLCGGLLYAHAPGACLGVAAAVAWTVVGCTLLDMRWGRAAAASQGEGDASPRESQPSAVPQARKRAFLLAGLLTNFALWGAVATLKGLAPVLAHSWRIGVEETGLLLAATLAAQGAGFLLLQDGRWAYRRPLLLAAAPAAAAGLLGLSWVAGLGLALPAALAIGWAQAVTYAASVYYSLDYDERRGLRTGIHEAVLAAGGTIPIVGGLLADGLGQPLAPLWLALALTLACALAAAWALRGQGWASESESRPSRSSSGA